MVKVSSEKFFETAKYLGATKETAKGAYQQLKENNVTLLGVSGWIASGKDTAAKGVFSALGQLESIHRYYGYEVKVEISTLINQVKSAESPRDAIEAIRSSQNVEASDAAFVAGVLWHLTRDDTETLTGWTRSKEVRTLLQHWGTNVRRWQNPDYWAKPTLAGALEDVATGKSVYFTDMRFPNEVELAQKIGFKIVRLEISREEQRRRLLGRDGFEPDPAVIYHESETQLDTYENFDLVTDANGTIEEVVDKILPLFK